MANKKILIVEDNEDSRATLSQLLQHNGFDVVEARDGKEGVALAQSEKPHLVLMDMNMPVLDGWEASRQIRTEANTQNLPIIALTAHAMEGDRDLAMRAGCNEFHAKPVDLPKLLAQIAEFL